MVLDQCPPSGATRDQAAQALERTLDWAERSIAIRDQLPEEMAVFGILQGGSHQDLRQEGGERLRELPFDGFAVGGVSVGEDRERLFATIPWGARPLPADRPRYLMGVAGFPEFVHAISHGIDLFDCVIPTRNARNGRLFLSSGEPLRIRNQRYADDPGPVDEDCDCETCRGFSRGFLHHLILRRELLGYTLASIHNLRVFHRFLELAREAIRAQEWASFSRRFGSFSS
jgi:queuine tRNA-ribosyltransferase